MEEIKPEKLKPQIIYLTPKQREALERLCEPLRARSMSHAVGVLIDMAGENIAMSPGAVFDRRPAKRKMARLLTEAMNLLSESDKATA